MKPLYKIIPNTYHKAFFLAAIISALCSGIAIEVHHRNLFNFYIEPERTRSDIFHNIFVTIFITGLLSYIISWIVRLLFGYGNSSLANDVKIK